MITGRWASSGGGALQLPRQLRSAVRADPGWSLVVADVAQLEPRVLAAMARDEALADAARGRDLYTGVVDRGAVATRAEAKVAMLGAMYGATTGDSGRLLPGLRRTFPRAMALVDDAARTGEAGGVVTTWLGPQRAAAVAGAGTRRSPGRARSAPSSADEARARRWAGDRGRFTRNFIVQGTAAEWALAWLAELRLRLAALPPVAVTDAAPRSGIRRSSVRRIWRSSCTTRSSCTRRRSSRSRWPTRCARPRHPPVDCCSATFPIDFPLDLRIAQSADKA